MKTILQLRTEIETILTDEIGSYQFSSGQTVFSCCVLPDSAFGWDFPPTSTQVQDLEVVIIPDAKLRNKLLTVQVNLKQWNPQKTTVKALKLLMEQLDNIVDVRPRILPNASLENIETQSIFIAYPVVYNWSLL